jgi:E3 ubiquitin-protein ligase TRIP12
MNELAQSRALLEIQYENKVGTGLSPTLEFYTLVSKELLRADLSLWKGDAVKISSSDVVMEENESGGNSSANYPCIKYVHLSAGLYPVPLARNTKSSHRNKVKAKFQFICRFIAKSVLDNRMIDLPFSLPFFQWFLSEEHSLSTGYLRNIDPTIATTVTQLEGIVRKKRRLEKDQ